MKISTKTIKTITISTAQYNTEHEIKIKITTAIRAQQYHHA